MLDISIPSESSVEITETKESDPLLDLVNVILVQLQHLQAQSPCGYILNEIVQRSEVLAINIKNEEFPALTPKEVKEYQKNLWQQLTELKETELINGGKTDFNKQKAVFFHLFKYMDSLICEEVYGTYN